MLYCDLCPDFATCSAYGYDTCERCQDDVHRNASKYPLHPAEQREALYEELDHAIENLSECRAEHGSGAVSLGYAPEQALDGFDSSPWTGFIADAEAAIASITAWIETHSSQCPDPGTDIFDGRATGYHLTSKADQAFDAKVAEVNELYEQSVVHFEDDIPF